LLQSGNGLEDADEHTGDGEDGSDGLEIVVKEVMHGDHHRPLTPVIINFDQDGMVAVAVFFMASEAFEKFKQLLVAEEAAQQVLRSQLVHVPLLVRAHGQDREVQAQNEAI
jgi:hypothetical protein